MVKSSLQELAVGPIDLKSLPHDSIYAARLRLTRDYNLHHSYNPSDLRIVLGDQTRGVLVYSDPKKMAEEFLELLNSG